MKTFIKIAGILCLLSVFLTFPACGSDDDDEPEIPTPEKPSTDIKDLILGNWHGLPADSALESILILKSDGSYHEEYIINDLPKGVRSRDGSYRISDNILTLVEHPEEDGWEHSYYFILENDHVYMTATEDHRIKQTFERTNVETFTELFGSLFYIPGNWIHIDADKKKINFFSFEYNGGGGDVSFSTALRESDSAEWETESLWGNFRISENKLILTYTETATSFINQGKVYFGKITDNHLILREEGKKSESIYERTDYEDIWEYLEQSGI